MELCSFPAIYLGSNSGGGNEDNGFPDGSEVKASAHNAGDPGSIPGSDPWVGKIPWRRKWQPIPVFLPGEFHGQRSLEGYSLWGHKESDMTEQLHFHFSEDNGDLLQKVPCSYLLLHSLLPTLQQAITDPHLSTRDSWTPLGKSGSVSCGITAPFSWVLVHTRFCLCPPRVYFPVLRKFWQVYCGVNSDLVQEGLCHTKSAAPRTPVPVAN